MVFTSSLLAKNHLSLLKINFTKLTIECNFNGLNNFYFSFSINKSLSEIMVIIIEKISYTKQIMTFKSRSLPNQKRETNIKVCKRIKRY